MKAGISNIQKFCIQDGPGIRTTVFFQACLMNCWWCHNPESIFHNNESAERFSTKYSVEKLLKEIIKDVIFYEESGGGVTFSGGEPLLQVNFLKEILKKCKSEKIHTCVDTTGYCDQDDIIKVSELCDLILYDLKIIDNKLHKKYTGVSNEKILKNLKYLYKSRKNILIRIPLIPGITDTTTNIMAIKNFLLSISKNHKINLLPYHKTAAGKYERYNIRNKMKDTKVIKEESLIKIKEDFTSTGFEVKIGG